MDKKYNILKDYDSNKCLFDNFKEAIEHQIKSILHTSEINVNSITSRLKDKESLKGKIDKKGNKYSSISDITDIVGVRIITYFSEDVDKVAEIIEKEFDIDRENTIDKRDALGDDKFGYCSLHYVVRMSKQRLKLREYSAYKDLKCEIQIRSVLQHAWAEIEHDIGYKSAITIPKEIRRKFSRIAGLLELADKEFNEIRTSLHEYENKASNNIDKEDFIDNDIDAVILETLVKHNPDIIELNNHISELMSSKRLVEFDNYQAERTIKQLNWFGISKVGQLLNTISGYKDFALKLSSKKLKDYKPDSLAITTNLISFFYLCYALLLKDHLNTKEIEKYFMDMQIGDSASRSVTVKEFYQMGLELNNKQ